jgi:hypothetical protein
LAGLSTFTFCPETGVCGGAAFEGLVVDLAEEGLEAKGEFLAEPGRGNDFDLVVVVGGIPVRNGVLG